MAVEKVRGWHSRQDAEFEPWWTATGSLIRSGGDRTVHYSTGTDGEGEPDARPNLRTHTAADSFLIELLPETSQPQY